MKLQIFKDGMQEAIKEFINISFERADINDLITNDPKFQPLQYFDPAAVFKADMNSLQMGQVLSFMENLQASVDKIEQKINSAEPQDSGLINRMLKVGAIVVFGLEPNN